MNRHLSDEEIAAAVAGLELAAEPARHLESCVTCRREVEDFLELIANRRGAMEVETPDWSDQQRRIMEQIDVPAAPVVPLHRRRLWRPVLAAAASLAAAVGIWLQVAHHRPAASTRPVPVEQILSEVDATLADQSVPGFESLDSLMPSPEEMVSMAQNTTTAS